MANKITVNIAIGNALHENSQIPDDYTIQWVIDELIDDWELERFDEKRTAVDYALYSLSSKGYLAPTDKAGDVLHDGETIRLEARVNGEPLDISPGPNAAIPHTVDDNFDQIRVRLKVLDLNRTEEVKFSTTVPVSELIKQIVVNYDLPGRDKQKDTIKYRLNSKALGDFLSEAKTLGQLGVPELDELTLHRPAVPGSAAFAVETADQGRGNITEGAWSWNQTRTYDD